MRRWLVLSLTHIGRIGQGFAPNGTGLSCALLSRPAGWLAAIETHHIYMYVIHSTHTGNRYHLHARERERWELLESRPKVSYIGGGGEQGHFFSVLKRRPHRAHLEHDHLTLPPRNTCASTVLERGCLFSERSTHRDTLESVRSPFLCFAMPITLRASAKFTIHLVSFFAFYKFLLFLES